MVKLASTLLQLPARQYSHAQGVTTDRLLAVDWSHTLQANGPLGTAVRVSQVLMGITAVGELSQQATLVFCNDRSWNPLPALPARC